MIFFMMNINFKFLKFKKYSTRFLFNPINWVKFKIKKINFIY